MRSPVASRLFPIRERPPGHWSRVWSHGTHVRPSIPQLRCRGAACEGDADASARVDSCSSLATQRTLISARTDVLVARASRCCCSWCCMLPSARSSTSGVHVTSAQEALISGTQTATTDSSLRLFTRGFQLYTQRDRAQAAQRRDLACDAMRQPQVFPTFACKGPSPPPSLPQSASHAVLLGG